MVLSRKKRLTTLIKVVLISFIFAAPNYAQTSSSPELLKVVWVYKFLNYIQWPNEKNLNRITISYWGDDASFYNNLLALNGKEVRSKQINVVRQQTMTPNSAVQVIVVGKEKNSSLSKLQSSLSGKNTLVITDSASNKQNIMINFVYPDANSITFELNRYNIIYEKLSLSSDILVIGGSEVDIAKVLNEINTKLDSTKLLLDQREGTLAALSTDIAEKEQKMINLQLKISKQTKDIDIRQEKSKLLKLEMDHLLSTLENSYAELTKSYEELAKNNKALDAKQKKLSEKEKDIESLSKAISANKLTLEQQIKHLAEQNEKLSNQEVSIVTQEKELLTQSSTIKRQNTLMFVSFAFIVLGIGMLVVLNKSSKNKKKSLDIVNAKNTELAETNDELVRTQSQLVESEKMAALGGLVAGVAHEINTPLGVSVTAITTSQHLLESFTSSVENNKVTRSEMSSFLKKMNQATNLITSNLIRANDLIRQFKLVAVDQSSEEKREFLLGEYLNEVLSSLFPQYKKYNCVIDVICDEKLIMNSLPGEVAQIVTNLVINSVIHGFTEENDAAIHLEVSSVDDNVIITYQDNGRGIEEEKLSEVFTPFYTTKRGSGGSGLGLHICYNVASKLGGDIKCVPCDSGAKFIITLLKTL